VKLIVLAAAVTRPENVWLLDLLDLAVLDCGNSRRTQEAHGLSSLLLFRELMIGARATLARWTCVAELFRSPATRPLSV